LTGASKRSKGLTNGAALGDADYRINVYQEFIVLHDGEELARMTDWNVQLSGHSLDTFGLSQHSARLTLELEGGPRQVQGFLDGESARLVGHREGVGIR
jgi:hypothetical protein